MKPIVAAALVALLWGISPIIHRMLLKRVSESFILLISAITYFIAVGVYVYFWKRKEVTSDFSKGGHLYIPLLSLTTLLGLFIANVIYLYAVKNAQNINKVVTITSLYPVITLIIASLWLKESLSLLGVFGFILIICGISVLLYSSNEHD